VKPADMAAARDSIRQDLVEERRSDFFSAYMVKARQKMTIETEPRGAQQHPWDSDTQGARAQAGGETDALSPVAYPYRLQRM